MARCPVPHRQTADSAYQILLVDEVLAVGDAEFQVKCLQRIQELRDRGVTSLFISHDLDVVEYLCDRVVVLYLGKVMEVAETRELFERPQHPYTRELLRSTISLSTRSVSSG